jgi:uncharacterized membrane protein
MDGKKRALLAASVAGILAAGLSSFSQGAGAHEEGTGGGTVHCYGVNKCKGSGDCGGKGHSCAGQNACKGQGYLDLNEDDCLRIEGGRLTEEPAD